MDKNRTRAQDIAKGMMIMGVVFFHCYLMIFATPSDALSSFNISMAIAPFLLSTFFFYAGYNYVANKRTFKENIIRRAKQLLIPLVVCFAISVLAMSTMELIFNHNDIGGTFHAIGNTILYSLMSEPLALLIGFPQSGGTVFSLILSLGLLWFLYCLFTCSIFFYLLVKFTNKRLINLISVVIVLLVMAFCLGEFVGTYLPYTVQYYPVVLAIMLTGAYLKQKNFLDREISSKKDIVLHTLNAIIAEGLVVGTCLICHYHFGALLTGSFPGGMFDSSLKGFDAFIGFGFSILGTYFIHTVSRLIKKIPGVGFSLAWLGSHSALFYLFHPIYIVFAFIVFFQKQIMWGIGQAFILFAFAILMLVLMCVIIDLIKRKIAKKPIESENVEEVKENV